MTEAKSPNDYAAHSSGMFQRTVARIVPSVARLSRVPVRSLAAAVGGHDGVVTGKGERRRVRQFRKEYVPASDQRSVRLPETEPEGGEIPREVLVKWLDYVQKGVEAMVEANPGLAVSRESPVRLIVRRRDQSLFQIYLEDDGRRLVVISPAKTGTMAHYRWDASAEVFVSVIDGHNALELIARDLLYTLNGVPDL
jgi:hypothetical protein